MSSCGGLSGSRRPDRVGRALKRRTIRGRLVRSSYALYARTTTARISGATAASMTPPMLAAKALTRLKVRAAPSTFDRRYNEGS